MAKRFTATEKWEDKWFRKLETKYKLLWIYILDKCDNAGLWEADLELAGMYTSFQYSEPDTLKILETRAYPVNGKWFIPKFIEFQYGKLNCNSKPHLSVIDKLKKYNLLNSDYTLDIPLVNPLVTPKDKDKDKEEAKDIAKEKAKDKGNKYNIIPPTTEMIIERGTELNYSDIQHQAERFFNHYESNGWRVGKNPMKNWSASLTNWYSKLPEFRNGTVPVEGVIEIKEPEKY